MPLARFSPIYGSVSLARFPLSEGLHAVSTAPFLITDPLWYAVLNVISWTLVCAAAYALVLRREKAAKKGDCTWTSTAQFRSAVGLVG